ncbi:MAG: HlyC/CorC family transporter [Burkholderiales bacterium]
MSTQLVTLAVLLVLSAFFSVAETSMMALNRYRLKAMVRLGNRGAMKAQALLDRTDRLLGVILLGNNLINAAAATLTGVIAIELFGENEVALAAGTLGVTFLILVFSEITPKVIGAAYAEKIALPASYILGPLLTALYPVVSFVNFFVNGLLWILRVKPPTDDENQRLTNEELRTLVLEHSRVLPRKHQMILVNLFDLEHITVQDVMTPRAQIEAIDLDSAPERIIEQIATSYHTRLIAFREELTNVVGILHIRRVLAAIRDGALNAETLTEMLLEPYFIPSTTPALAQLQFFQENRERVGLVVDEYGEVLGLVTLEDIIEEIVGEFTTNAPIKSSDFAWNPDGEAVVEGSSSLRELNRKLGLALPVDGPKTLNGLITEYLQDIPAAGVSMRIGGIALEILQTEDRVVKTVRIFQPRPVPVPH